MSSLTQCNYCRLKTIKRNKQKGSKVLLRRSSFMGGVDVFVVPKGEKLDTTSPDDGGKQWRCWFLDIGNGCIC